ncbi:MAG TPA: PEP-CTERM sorting domain-containing protein [Verrucomicrobiae bacterium]|jgi:hypothetical protein
MKRIIVVAVLLVASGFFARAQGTVNFANGAAGVNAPVSDAGGTPLLQGSSGFVAQLFGGPQGTPVNSLSPMGTAIPFLSGAGAGYFLGGETVVTNVAGNAIAELVVRVWNTVNGATFAAASLVDGAHVGSSLPIDVTLASPPTAAPNMTALQPFSLTIVSIVPEPSAIILGGLGAIAVLLRRRKD